MAYQKLQAVLDSAPDVFYIDWTFLSRESSFVREISVHEGDRLGSPESWTYAPHAATGYVQDQLWWDSSWFIPSDHFQANGRTSGVVSKSAFSKTVCLWQIISLNSTQVILPTLTDDVYVYGQQKNISVPSSLWASDGRGFIDPEIVRTLWIDQSEVQQLGSVTAGLIIMEPVVSPDATNRAALGCAVDARWADSTTNQTDGLTDIAITTDILRAGPTGTGFVSKASWPVTGSWSKVTATSEWLQALTPTLPYLSSALNLSIPATTLANLLMRANHFNIPPPDPAMGGYEVRPYKFWEFVVSTLFADALSRVGYAQQLDAQSTYVNGSIDISTSCDDGPCTFTCKIAGPGAPNMWNICSGPPPSNGNFTQMALEGKILGSKSLPFFDPETPILFHILKTFLIPGYTLTRKPPTYSLRIPCLSSNGLPLHFHRSNLHPYRPSAPPL